MVFLKIFSNLTGKHLCWSETYNFIKKRIQHGCFPVKFAKFLRTSFFTEPFRWLLLFTLPCYTYLLIRALRAATLSKRDSDTGVFLCIIRMFIYFEEHLRTAASDYSLTIVIYLFSTVSLQLWRKTMIFYGDHWN